jgi:hypothetical protein
LNLLPQKPTRPLFACSYLLEGIRPEIQQYLIEPEDVAAPYSRVMRNTIYQRAKMKVGTDTHSLGTRRDVYKPVSIRSAQARMPQRWGASGRI